MKSAQGFSTEGTLAFDRDVSNSMDSKTFTKITNT